MELIDNYKILAMKFIMKFGIIISSIFFAHSCAEIKQYSTFNPIVGIRDTVINTPGISDMWFYTEDSILFYVEPFYGGKEVLFGPPYLPIVPNIFYPFTFFHDNKKQSYHLTLYSTSDVNVNRIEFYRNKKRMEPIAVNIANLATNIHNKSKYLVIDTLKNVPDSVLRSHTYYRFSFYIRTFTMKEIEIKYAGKTILHIKRKKKLKLENNFIFAS